MGRKRSKNNNTFRTPNQLTQQRGNRWFFHYYEYLLTVMCQLFEWSGLPDSVSPRYLEKTLIENGHVGFYKDPSKGYIVSKGTMSGIMDHYEMATQYHCYSPVYQATFNVFNYPDMVGKNMGVIIQNNDMLTPSLSSLELFSQELSEIKEITRVNLNAQKTPFFIFANDNNKLSLMQVFNQVEANVPAVFVHESLDPSSIVVHQTNSPYIVDKMSLYKHEIWNEIMTYMGIGNANQNKKERLVANEVEANNQQVESSSNVFLKSRKEACERINKLYNLNVDVKLRLDSLEELKNFIEKDMGGEGLGKLHI